MEIEPDWHQDYVVRCPDCKGLLLQSDYYHKMKCSECGKYWMSVTKLVQVPKPIAERYNSK